MQFLLLTEKYLLMSITPSYCQLVAREYRKPFHYSPISYLLYCSFSILFGSHMQTFPNYTHLPL